MPMTIIYLLNKGLKMTDIKVSADQWNSLSQDDKSRVETILKATTLLKENDHIVPDPQASRVETPAQAGQTESVFCEIACRTAQAAAVAACATIPEPITNAACIAAAIAAGEACLDEC